MSKTSVKAPGRESRLQATSYQLKRHVPHFLYSIFRYAFIIGMAYVLLYPILIMVTRAVRPMSDMDNPSIVWIPSGITWQNLQMAWQRVQFPTTLLFTCRVVLISTLLSLISCSMAGYAMARYRMKLNGLFMAIAIFTIVVPMQTYIIPLFLQMKYYTPLSIGNLLAVITGGDVETFALFELTEKEWCYYITSAFGSGLRSGLFILVFMQFFKGMPKELEDAARVDGCSELRTFVQVMVPNAGAPFLVVTLFSIVWYWNDYYFAQMMMPNSNMFAPKLSLMRTTIHNLETEGTNTTQTSVVLFAGALLFILPPLILYLYLQKYFVQSIERTGIVG